jgi:hypothetical protein
MPLPGAKNLLFFNTLLPIFRLTPEASRDAPEGDGWPRTTKPDRTVLQP